MTHRKDSGKNCSNHIPSYIRIYQKCRTWKYSHTYQNCRLDISLIVTKPAYIVKDNACHHCDSRSYYFWFRIIPVNDEAKTCHHQHLKDRSNTIYCACYRFCPKDIIRSRDNKPDEVWYHYDQKKDKAYPVKADSIVFQHSNISTNPELPRWHSNHSHNPLLSKSLTQPCRKNI